MSNLADWLPQDPALGPPLPRFLSIYWPWHKAEATPVTPVTPPITTPEVPPAVTIDIALAEAISKDGLAQLRAQFELDYQSGKITRDRYLELYTIYIRRSYYLDLYLRGWEVAPGR